MPAVFDVVQSAKGLEVTGEGSGAVWRQGNQVYVRLHVTPTDATESIQVSSHRHIWALPQPPPVQVALTLSLKYKPSTPSVRPSDVGPWGACAGLTLCRRSARRSRLTCPL